MASPVLSESKQMFKRIVIGVVTGVSGAVIIYFLGFNRGKSGPSEIEVKKNTIEAWKVYVAAENGMQIKLDSTLAKTNRVLTSEKTTFAQRTAAARTNREQDSVIFTELKIKLEELKETKDIDKELSILFNTRSAYLNEQMINYFNYKTKFDALIADSLSPRDEVNEGFVEVNKLFGEKTHNLFERMGRSIEDLSGSLSKKYEYAFALSDFRFYNFYMMLKKTKNQPKLPEVAPSDPGKEDPALPD